MKILILGAGGIGGYYGGRLIEAGADVTFLVRETRARQLDHDGLKIESEAGNARLEVKTVSAETVGPDYDLVIMTNKAYDLDTAILAVEPALGPSTLVLPFLNGLSAYDRLDSRFGRACVLGGVAQIAVGLTADGTVKHTGTFDSVTLGSRDAQAKEKARAIHELFAKTPGQRRLSDTIEQDLWSKWVLVTCGAMMTSLMRGSIGDILATTSGRMLIEQAMRECCGVALRSGYALPDTAVQNMRSRLLDQDSNWNASMARDIARGAPRIEADAIVGDMIRRAAAHDVEAPLLTMAYCNLQVYQNQQNRRMA